MSYENPQLPEGINIGPHRPVLDFFVQGSLALFMLVALVWGIFQMGSLIGPLIPFEWEKQVAGLAMREGPMTPQSAEGEARQDVLQRLTDDLTPHLELPDGMDIIIHYHPSMDVNAFATLGGNVIIHEGLIERLPSENALSMVIAHEIGHVKHRDVMRGMGGRMLLMMIVGLATGDTGLAAEVVQHISLLTELHHSRSAEEWADREGVTALYGNYGHVNGYRQTFDALLDWINDMGAGAVQPPEFLRTHPDISTRVRKLEAFAAQNGWPEEGEMTDLRQANFPPPVAPGGWGGNDAPIEGSIVSPKQSFEDNAPPVGNPVGTIDLNTISAPASKPDVRSNPFKPSGFSVETSSDD